MYPQSWLLLRVAVKTTAYATALSSTEVVKGHLLIVRAEIDNNCFCFVKVYAPNHGTEREGIFILTKITIRIGSSLVEILIVDHRFHSSKEK